MHVLVMSFGTRGDIQPYAAFARGLARAGHDVTLAVPDGFADLVGAGAGPGTVTIRPAGTEMLRLVQDVMPEARGARDAVRAIGAMKDAMRRHMTEVWEAARAARPDVVVHHPKTLAGPHVAEALGVPGVLTIPLPFYTPTSAFPIPFTGARSLGGPLNRATYAFRRMATIMYGGMIDDFRREAGLTTKVARFSDPLRGRDGAPVPVLYPYSRHVVPIPPDFPPSAHVTGYFFRDDDGAWEPPAALADFLAAGPPPVYLGFGSMGFGKGAGERRDAILKALAATGLRGIVATGWGGITPGDAPSDDVLVIEGAPHEWLFPRVSAVVHHGGAGSTAAGLRAGKPTLVVPFLADQPFWGGRVHAIGAGPAPLPRKRFADGLAARLADLTGNPGYARRAAALGELIRAEDGVAAAVRLMERIAGSAPVAGEKFPG